MKKALITLFLISYISTIYAVEGYKGLKFGISKEETIKSGICSFKEFPKNKSEPWFEKIRCLDLKLGNKDKFAVAIFVRDKFVRFVILIELSDIPDIVETSNELYGPLSSWYGSPENIYDPGNDTGIKYDNDTLIITVRTNKDSLIFPYLNYQIEGYDDLINKYRNYSKMEI